MTWAVEPGLLRDAADAAVRKAESEGLVVTVVFVDEHDVLSHVTRMPGARALGASLARRKASTSAVTARATHEWARLIAADPALGTRATVSLPDLVLFGGGVPVGIDGRLLGAFGVSGAAEAEDQRLAEHAAATLASLLDDTTKLDGEEGTYDD